MRLPFAVLAGSLACVLLISTGHASAGGQEPSRIDALVAEGRLRDAVAVFESEVDASKGVRPDALKRLAVAVLESATRDADPSLAADACLTLLRRIPHGCDIVMQPLALNPSTPAVVRIRALARRVSTDPAARRTLDDLVADFQTREWTAVVDRAGDFPVDVRRSLLTKALAAGKPEVQYAALQQLAAMEDPATLGVCRQWASRTSTPGHLFALAAVARAGDPAALARIRTLLPSLDGEELLASSVALAKQNDAQGLDAVRRLLTGADELLQLKAAAALADLGDPTGRARLERELTNTNPWIRLRSLEYFVPLSPTPTPEVWRLMADDMPEIQIRAAEASLVAATGQLAPKPAK